MSGVAGLDGNIPPSQISGVSRRNVELADRKVVVATNNPKKLAELNRIFAEIGLAVELLNLSQVPFYPEPAETERTFAGNALIKARAAAAATGLIAIADDSGLEVEVLNQMPGVRSARWAGPGADDSANLDLLLSQISDVPSQQRAARFVCAMALVTPDGFEYTTRGEMIGQLVFEPVGENGFGYDPAFIAAGFDVTNGQLSPEVKDSISHRGKAVRQLAEFVIVNKIFGGES